MDFLLCLIFFISLQKTYENSHGISTSSPKKLSEILRLALSILFFITILKGSVLTAGYFITLISVYHINCIAKMPAIFGALMPLLFYRLLPYIENFIPSTLFEVLIGTTEVTNANIKYAMAPIGIAFITLAAIDVIMNSNSKEKLNSKITFLFYPPKVLGPIDMWSNFSKITFKKTPISPIILVNLSLVLIMSSLRICFAYYTQRYVFYILDTHGKTSLPLLMLPIIGLVQMCILYNSIQGVTELSQALANLGNISLADNFKKLYSARYFSEFWQRWHINITKFFGVNLYRPLRRRNLSVDISTIIVFIAFAFWHGAYLELTIFGLLSGLLIVFERRFELIPNRLRTFFVMSIVFSLSVPNGLFHRLTIQALFNFSDYELHLHSILFLVTSQVLFFLVAGWSSQRNIKYLVSLVAKLPRQMHIIIAGIAFGIAYQLSPFLLGNTPTGYGYL